MKLSRVGLFASILSSHAFVGQQRGFSVVYEGSCRDADGGKGAIKEFQLSLEECSELCLGDPACYAIEDEENICEYHTAPITDASVKGCQIKALASSGGKSGLGDFKPGKCRTADGGKGVYQMHQLSLMECSDMCAADSACYAIEHEGFDCEIHTEPIAYVQKATCYIK